MSYILTISIYNYCSGKLVTLLSMYKTRHATVMMDLADEDERMRRINQIYAFVPGNT